MDQAPAAPFTLYNAPAVTLATFFGTPAAGSLLMALNFSRLGEKGYAAMILILGFLVTGLAIAFGFFAPKAVTYPLGLALLLGMRFLATKLQGEAVAQHVSRGGKLGSKWIATGVGVGFFCLLFAGVAIPVFAASAQGKPGVSGSNAFDLFTSMFADKSKVTIGENDEVYYTGTATKEDAQKLGAALKTDGYFKDRGVSVFLDKGANGTTISMVVQEAALKNPGIQLEEEEVAREVADSVGGLPIHVKLIDKYETVKMQGIVGRASLDNKDEVFYFGNATQTEAESLVRALQKEDYFGGRGASVLLSKDGDGTSISFVVSDGFWDDPSHVAGFEAVVKAVAPSVGGLPVTLRLVNTGLEDKKDSVVK
jgi:hypothetical protein